MFSSIFSAVVEVSRVHSDTLRTLVVGPGLCGEVHVSVSLDVYGTLVFQRDDEQLFSFSIGTAFRGELTVWQMLLRGKDTQISRIFRSMDVEDSEATLSEHLGDAVLRLRHLGSHADGVMLLNRNSISRPGGDHGPSDGIAKVQKNSQDPDPDLYLDFVSLCFFVTSSLLFTVHFFACCRACAPHESIEATGDAIGMLSEARGTKFQNE